MAANEMYIKYSFAGKYSVQFVLAGLQIDTDTNCPDDSSNLYEYDLENLETLDDYDTDNEYSLLDLFLTDDYYENDEDWSLDYDDNTVPLNEDNCYEQINGVVNITTEFCKLFLADQGAHYLNMFSTLDHSNYCLAHIWTYRFVPMILQGYQTSDSASSSKFHHCPLLALLVALVLH